MIFELICIQPHCRKSNRNIRTRLRKENSCRKQEISCNQRNIKARLVAKYVNSRSTQHSLDRRDFVWAFQNPQMSPAQAFLGALRLMCTIIDLLVSSYVPPTQAILVASSGISQTRSSQMPSSVNYAKSNVSIRKFSPKTPRDRILEVTVHLPH